MILKIVMSTIQHCYCFTVIAALCMILTGLVQPSMGAQEMVDPHWTGKHCTECHVAEKGPELRFDGDVVKLCNRCHLDDHPACTKVHSEKSILPVIMGNSIPADWPLVDSKMTCLTCHAVPLQMYINPIAEKVNENFLRTDSPEDIFSFCFNCHQQERFQKTNPHQITPGAEIRSSCFICHTDDLATGNEDRFQASVKTKSPSLCSACHGKLNKMHFVHEALEADAFKANEASLLKLDEEGIELPLVDGRMHCATCHNPHLKGIIGRKKAAIGAGEKYFLRIPKVNDLCGACHAEKSLEEYIQRFQHN
jgi:hypothetical protein